MEKAQYISIGVNSFVLLLSILITGIFVWKLNLRNKNNRLLFILYILYWMVPLLCREYTGQMHIHMEEIHDLGSLLFVPLIVYGLIGIIWRPLNDLFSFKMHSRRNVIFISLGIQLVTIIPFLINPCFATNIIQSLGSGIGASAIGMFNLMFAQQCHHEKIFKTVSIIALPPILAEVISSALECIVTTCLEEGEAGIYTKYTSVMLWLWIAAIFFICASFVITLFIKEERAELYVGGVKKEAVKHHSDRWVVALICIAGAAVLFIRWITVGPIATSQLIYMGFNLEVDIRFYEGYFTVLYALGQLAGTALAWLWLNKSKHPDHIEKPMIVVIATVLWLIYLGITGRFVNIPVYYLMSLVNGIAMGLVWPVLTGMIMNKMFMKNKIITPMGVYNMSLSIGISLGTFYACFTKGQFFDFESFRRPHLNWELFERSNLNCNIVSMFIILGALLCVVAAYCIHIKYPPKMVKISKHLAVTNETEI